MYRICVLRRCSRHVICSVMVAATVIGRGNLAPTGNRVELERQDVGWDQLSACEFYGISIGSLFSRLTALDRPLWFSGEGTSPLRVIELSWSDKMSTVLTFRSFNLP